MYRVSKVNTRQLTDSYLSVSFTLENVRKQKDTQKELLYETHNEYKLSCKA
jgi:hypothetical protein